MNRHQLSEFQSLLIFIIHMWIHYSEASVFEKFEAKIVSFLPIVNEIVYL